MKHESNTYENLAAFALKETIKKTAREDKKIRLEACWNLLLELYMKGERDFSTTKMGNALEARKIQRSQSYRNNQGKDYRDIVKAFADEMGARIATVRSKSLTPLEEALKSIQDLDVQVRVRSMFDDLNRLRAENNILRHEMSRMQRVSNAGKSYPNLEGSVSQNENRTLNQPNSKPELPTSSLRTFLQDEWMNAHDLTVNSVGTILCAGRPITLPGFARQLNLLLGT